MRETMIFLLVFVLILTGWNLYLAEGFVNKMLCVSCFCFGASAQASSSLLRQYKRDE